MTAFSFLHQAKLFFIGLPRIFGLLKAEQGYDFQSGRAERLLSDY